MNIQYSCAKFLQIFSISSSIAFAHTTGIWILIEDNSQIFSSKFQYNRTNAKRKLRISFLSFGKEKSVEKFLINVPWLSFFIITSNPKLLFIICCNSSIHFEKKGR
jgi:hypothetical protein